MELSGLTNNIVFHRATNNYLAECFSCTNSKGNIDLRFERISKELE